MKFLLLILKNLRRNKIRTALTALAVLFLVAIFSMIGTILLFLDRVMAEKKQDVKTIVTERYRIPSRFDRSYMDRMIHPGSTINQELNRVPGFHGENHNIWHFVICTTDPKMEDKDSQFFIIATLPDKMLGMIDGVEGLPDNVVDLMRTPPRSGLPNTGLVMGPDAMEKLKKKVGDGFKVKCISHREGTGARLPLEFEFEVIATFGARSMWAEACFMDYAYLDRVLKDKRHEMDGKIMIGWLKVDDAESANQIGGVIEQHLRELKSETMSAAISRQMGLFGGMLWGIKFLLTPAILLVMTIILANSISITVRERMGEMAIMKVLGYGRWHIIALVLGEGMLVGVLSGFLSGGLTYGIITHGFDGLKLGPDAGRLFVSGHAVWWGAVIGVITSILAGIVPALNASQIKVSEVFSKIA